MGRSLRESYAAQAALARSRFVAALDADKAAVAQQTLLDQCVMGNADTVFGREHGFASIRDMDAYRAQVPIRHYEQLSPWIERATEAEPSVLTKSDPIRFWKTTGTTSRAKRIPVTAASQARITESFLALQGTQLSYHPETNERADTTLVAHLSPKPIKEYLGGGKFPFCSTTEVPIDVGPRSADFVAPWLVPLQQTPENDAERLYFLLAFTSLHDLRAIYCLHPSRFQTIAAALDKSIPRLVEELRAGTLLGVPAREPRPDRAAQLAAIAERTGTLKPNDVWPNLVYVSSWSGSYISRYMPVIESHFSRQFLAMPSISSECFLTMTIDDDRIGQPLNIRGGIFEFIPAETKVEDHTPTLQFHELSLDATYEVVITTLAGLYRYATADIFRVTGFAGGVPRFEYIGRRSVSDLTGEKLAEEQVSDVMKSVLGARDLTAANFTLCAVQDDGSGVKPRYVLALEAALTSDAAADLAAQIDARFRTTNSRYELKRNFNDLDPVRVDVLAPGTFAEYRALLIKRGMPAGQLKDRILYAVGRPVLTDLLTLSKALRP
ncbi:MAG TPA: GH3 auxin-responsive promoter family protein [Kofleriaceae bacterium]